MVTFKLSFQFQLFLLVSLCSFLVLFVTLLKFGKNFSGGGILTILDPWVGNDIWDREALVRVEAEHGRYQVFELLVEEVICLALRMGTPELLRTVCGNQLVVRVFHVSHVEWWVTCVHNEKDTAKCEQVDHRCLIWLLCMNFWRHET